MKDSGRLNDHKSTTLESSASAVQLPKNMKNIIYSFTLLLLLLSSCSEPHLIIGSRDLKQGKYIEAQRAFEQALLSGADTAQASRGLAIAKFMLNDSTAIDNLRVADSLSKEANEIALLHGIAAQENGLHSEAVDAYHRSLQVPALKPHAAEIKGVRSMLQKADVRSDVRAQLEQQRSSPKIDVNSIAVLPMSAPQTDTLLAMIAVGLVDFITTDLSKVRSLVVVERDRLADLLVEMNRYKANYDVSTLPKKGKLIGAARLVDAGLSRKKKLIVLDARVVKTQDGKVQMNASESGSDEDVFRTEKRLVLTLLERMKISITAEERRDILTPETENLLAFYAYCRGLQAADRLDYASAEKHFDEAAKIDPGFSKAIQRRNNAREQQQPVQSLRPLVKELFPMYDHSFNEALVKTGAALLEAGFLNAGNARRDGPTVLPFPPNP